MIDNNYMMFDEAVRLTGELVKINSYELEGKLRIIEMIRAYLAERTDAVVKTYDLDTDAPYLVATLECERPEFRLMLQGHIDTVSPEGMDNPFEGTVIDGRIRGRGAADMKSGCATLLAVFAAAAGRRDRRGEIHLAFSSDEEYNAAEMVKALELGHLPKCDLCLITEPSSGRMHVAHKGNAWIKVNFHGSSAHASEPEAGVNAVYMANSFINELRAHLGRAYTEADDLCGRATMNLGTISGGTTPNVVPPYCCLTLDKRYLPEETIVDFQNEVQALLDKCQEKDPAFRGDYEVMVDCTPMKFPLDSPLFGQVMEAAERAAGRKIEYGAMAGWGEGGFIQKFGIPVLYYGPGLMGSAHTPTEDVAVADIIEAVKVVYAVAELTCLGSSASGPA